MFPLVYAHVYKRLNLTLKRLALFITVCEMKFILLIPQVPGAKPNIVGAYQYLKPSLSCIQTHTWLVCLKKKNEVKVKC